MTVKRQSGFTLIEILVTMSIVAVAFGILITAAARIQKSARDAQRKSDLKKIQLALQQYYVDQGFYPETGGMQAAMYSLPPSALTNAVGNPNIPTATKIYLNPIPNDPRFPLDGAFGVAYWYDARISVTDGSTCDNTVLDRQCHFYFVRAALETVGGPYFSPPYRYNYQVTPLQ